MPSSTAQPTPPESTPPESIPPCEKPPRIRKRKVSDLLRGKLGAGLMRGLGLLPLGWNRAIGNLIGAAAWRLQGKTVQIANQNIAKCLPHLSPNEQQQLAKQSMRDTSCTALETASVWRQPYARLARYIVELDNFELMQTNVAKGKGVLLLAPHLGNWEILGAYLAQHFAVCYMFQPTEVPELDAVMETGRSHHGASLAPTSRKGVSMVLAHLKSGGLAAILPDQVPDPSGGKPIPFFGHNAWTITLVHKLKQRTGCEAMMGFAKRVPGGFTLIFREPEALLGDDDEFKSLCAMNKSVEDLVALAPAQYQWEYKRFKGIKQ